MSAPDQPPAVPPVTLDKQQIVISRDPYTDETHYVSKDANGNVVRGTVPLP